MTRKQVHAVYVLTFVVAASVTTQILSSIQGAEFLGALVGMEQVSFLPTEETPSKNEASNNRRMIREVIETCRQRAQFDATIDCPDINEPWAVKRFMRQADTVKHGAAPQNEGLDPTRLKAEQRVLLQKYVDEGRCPQTLRRVFPGFYELCLSLTVRSDTRTIEGREKTPAERRQERLEKRLAK